jgi:ABC-2 type transport system permease protein
MSAIAVPPGSGRPALRTRPVSDVLVLTGRNLAHIAREPLRLSDVTIQPVVFTLLFVYVLGSAVGGAGNYTQFAIAGLLGMNLATSATGTAIGLSSDLATGVIDRFRTLPVWRPAILVGRTVSDLLGAAVCAAIVAVTGLVMGWRPAGSVLATIAGFAIFLLFSYGLSWACSCLALVTDGPESAQGISLVILFPLAFISNALVPTEHMPPVLRAVADWNPLSAVTAAARRLWGNPNPSAGIHAWPMQHPVWAALGWSMALIAVFAPLAAWLYRRRMTSLPGGQ